MRIKNKITHILIISLFFPSLVWAQIDPGFTPNKLIEDKIFVDIETFGGAEGIQKFLENKRSVLANTTPSFLALLKEPNASSLKTGLDDPNPNLGRLRTAAELIWDASRQSGLNPQVILVTLQKEQGLITNHQDSAPEKLQKALDRAMGFDCPDSTGCGNLFPGFYYQLFGNFDSENNRYLGAARSLVKSYGYPEGRGPTIDSMGVVYGNGGGNRASKVGDTITVDNTQGPPYNAPPTSTFSILNRATAALYRYTPHVFNGNYNFWKFFQSWFKYPNGTLFALAGDNSVYIVQNGNKQLVPNFVAASRKLDLTKKITVSPNEFDNYPTDIILGPTDNTIVKDESGKTFVFISNIKHPASGFVISQRGLDLKTALAISNKDSDLFNLGSVLTPKDGTVIKGAKDAGIYLSENGKIKLYSEYVFKQRKVSPKKIVIVPDEEISTYEKQGFVPPLDGTLVKSPDLATVYLVENGLKRPVIGDIFKNRGFSFRSVATISKDEVSSLPIGAYATPKERTFFALGSKTGPLYIYKEGTKHNISEFVARQRGITPDYVFPLSVGIEWFDGIPIPPKDNTLVKGDLNPTIYLVSKGQLRALTGEAFKRRKYSLKKVVTLPQVEVESYAKGEIIEK